MSVLLSSGTAVRACRRRNHSVSVILRRSEKSCTRQRSTAFGCRTSSTAQSQSRGPAAMAPRTTSSRRRLRRCGPMIKSQLTDPGEGAREGALFTIEIAEQDRSSSLARKPPFIWRPGDIGGGRGRWEGKAGLLCEPGCLGRTATNHHQKQPGGRGDFLHR